jgi:hypothetical protein
MGTVPLSVYTYGISDRDRAMQDVEFQIAAAQGQIFLQFRLAGSRGA